MSGSCIKCGHQICVCEIDKDVALKLAGKLATAASLVIQSDTMNLSDNILRLNEIVVEYNNYILKYTK